jgi:Protein kinase domain
MGTVYVAHDPVLGRMVAIKVFAGDLDVPDARERFSREARASAALNHPNIVTVYDFGEFEAQPYIVMEYVPGETVANFIRRKVPVSIGDKLRWMEELCAGAGYAHQNSVIHRDIKPANLMIDRSGRLKILDFGIARMLGIASNTSVMIGTPGYMAPEQITGDPIDHRSDQFSIGVVFYELLAYTDAFPGDTLPAITHRILTEEPKPLSGMVADANPEIIAIVEQSLRKKVSERFRDTEAMRLAIARVRRHTVSDDSWNGQTMPLGRDVTPPGGANRGTGSARRRASGAVGVAQLTPPPDPRRADRESLARRRAAQVEAALADARQLLANQQLEAALDACQQALTLDEAHVGALELEGEIEEALQLRDGVAGAVDDPDMTVASDQFGSVQAGLDSRLVESQAVTRIQDDAYAAAGSGTAASQQEPGYVARQADSSPVAKQDPPSFPPVEATIVVPSRRTPSPTQGRPATIPPSGRPATLPPRQATVPPVAKAPAPSVAKTLKAKVPVQKQPTGPDFITRLTAATEGLAQSLRTITPVSVRQYALAVWGIAALVVVLAIIASVYFLTRGPVPTGVLVIDAVPWATVSAIQDESGRPQALPSSASTPLSLALPAGNYRVTLTGPPPESKVVTVNVRVDVNGVAVIPITKFQTVTPEQYFEQYLGSTTASAPAETGQPGADAQPGAAAPSAAPATPSGGNQ